MTSVLAVYENGVLRPKVPLHLAEGQEVEVTMVDAKPVSEPISDEEYLNRLQAAKSLQEMFAVMDSGPPEPELDIMEAVNESRRLTGFRMPEPKPQEVAG